MNTEVAIMINAIDRASKVFAGVSKSARMALTPIMIASTAAAAAVGGLTAKFGQLLQAGVMYNAQMETFKATLETTLKSETKAIEKMAWAKKFAAETPFQIPEVIQATVRLSTYNIEVEKSLRNIGNMAAIMGKPLMQAIEAIADAQTGELERLKEFGITKKMLIEKGLAVNSRGQIQDMTQMMDIMMDIMVDRYTDGMKKMMKGFTGIMSNLKDYWGQVTGVLAETTFEEIKKHLASLAQYLNEFKESGRLDKVMAGWQLAGQKLIQTLAGVVKAVGPQLLARVETLGKHVSTLVRSLDVEVIIAFAKKLYEFGETAAKASIKIVTLTAKYWKWIAALAALSALSSVISMLLGLTSAVIGATTVFTAFGASIAAGTAGLVGPLGIAAALGYATGLLINHTLKVRDAKKAQKELNKERAEANKIFKEAMADAPMIVNNLTGELQSILAINRQLGRLKETRKEILLQMREYNDKLREASTFGRSGGMAATYYKDKIKELSDELSRNSRIAARVAAQKKKLDIEIALPKGPRKLKEKEEDKEDPKEKARLAAIAALKASLAKEYTTMVLGEVTIQRKAVMEWSQEQIKQAKGDADLLMRIETMKQMKLSKIQAGLQAMAAKVRGEEMAQDEFAETSRVAATKQAMAELVRLRGDDTTSAVISAKARRDAVLMETGDKTLANKIYVAMMDQYYENLTKSNMARIEAEAKVEERELERKTQEYLSAQQRIFDGNCNLYEQTQNMRNAGFELEILQLDRQIEKYQEVGYNEVLIAEWKAGRVLEIKERESQRVLDLELNTLYTVRQQYTEYLNTAIDLSSILFSSQEQGALRVLAQLIRLGARALGNYMMEIAQIKLKEAAEAKAQAKWHLAHGSKMTALAAEAAAKAALYTAEQNYVAAAAAGVAAAKFGAAALADGAAAATFTAEATKDTATAYAEMAGSVAVIAGGELAARGIEKEAQARTTANREAERQAEERARIEKQLSMDVLKVQEGNQAYQLKSMEDQAEEYRKLGIDASLLAQWETARKQELGGLSGGGGGTVVSGDGAVPTVAWESPMRQGASGGTTTVHNTQNFYIDGWVNSADETFLREFAAELQPYIEEVENQAREG